MTTYYSIVKIGFEYNDEIYSSGEGSYGNPIKLYKSKASAEEECRNLNLIEIKNSELYTYGYGWNDIIGYRNPNEAAVMTMIMSYGFSTDLDEDVDLTKLSDADLEMFVDSINFKFYKVVPVKLVD